MSYPRDIDEIPESDLIKEINRRRGLRKYGLCDYCEQDVQNSSISSCKMISRHVLTDEYNPMYRRVKE